MRATITDLKRNDGSKYKADLSSANTYYPFGMLMPERNWYSDWYRYGFQGQEKDDEIKGEGNSINYKYRMHDTHIGRFLSLDPIASKFPHNSPYAFSENRVIDGIELEGLEWTQKTKIYNDGWIVHQRTVYVKVRNSSDILTDRQALIIAAKLIPSINEIHSMEFENQKIAYETKVVIVNGDPDPEKDFFIDVEDAFSDEFDSFRPGYVSEIGNTRKNEINIAGTLDGEPLLFKRTAAHEVAHTGGLTHPDGDFPQIDPKDPSNSKNLMWQSEKSLGTDLLLKQMQIIDEIIFKQNPFIIDGFNTGDVNNGSSQIDNTSTNIKPNDVRKVNENYKK